MKHPFFDILKSFSRDDLHSFKKFVSSLYFNGSPKLLKLYEIIMEFYPSFERKILSKEFLHSVMGSGLHYNESTMTNLLHDLQQLGEKFLVQRNYELGDAASCEYLFNELQDRALFRILSKKFKHNGFGNKGKEGINVYRELKLCEAKYNYSMVNWNMPGSKSIESRVAMLSRRNKLLSLYSLTEFIKGIILWHNFGLSFGIKKECGIPPGIDIEKSLEQLKYDREIGDYKHFVSLYLKVYRLFTGRRTASEYKDFKRELKLYSGKLDIDERNFLFMVLVDYCTTKSRKIRWFSDELFRVYKLILGNGYFRSSKNYYVMPDLWRNVIRFGLKTGRYNWTESLISNYKNELHPSQAENLQHYGIALLNFEKKEFDVVYFHLNKLSYDYFPFKLDVKCLMLMVYFELKHLDSAMSLVHSYMHLLNSEMVNPDKKARHINFIRFICGLIKIKLDPSQSDSYDLEFEIQKCDNTLYKGWLIEKCNELVEYKKAV